MKILLTGASGLIGTTLGRKLSNRGYELFVVSRNKELKLPFPFTLIRGDLTEGPIGILQQHHFDAVFHLMGETVAQRWTTNSRKKIYESRINSTQNLIRSLKRIQHFIQASAIGYYGDQGNLILSEKSSKGSDFLSNLCYQWEKEGEQIKLHFKESRWAALRIGLVLSENGGALQKMIPSFRLGLGTTLGTGNQYMSWVHIEDLVQIFLFTLDNTSISGPINSVTPNPITNKEFSKSLARVLKRPLFFSAPALILRAALGEMTTILLSSQNVSPQKLLDHGFEFKFDTIDTAFRELF